MSSISDAIREVLAASDSIGLFGTNAKRARIRYHRLVREVHPDSNGNSPLSNEAMRRLNLLWQEYGARSGTARNHSGPTEITRSATFAVFDEGLKWMVVERRPSDSIRFSTDNRDIETVLCGTPVCLLGCERAKLISQSNGMFPAYETTPPDSILGGITFLSSIELILPGGTIHPADYAWISKRVLFLSCALQSRGLAIGCDDAMDCLAIAPDTHMMAVVARLVNSADPWDGRDTLIRQYLDDTGPFVRHDASSFAIRRFLDGVIGDRWADAGRLMWEYDELMVDKFGGLRFHEMETM